MVKLFLRNNAAIKQFLILFQLVSIALGDFLLNHSIAFFVIMGLTINQLLTDGIMDAVSIYYIIINLIAPEAAVAAIPLNAHVPTAEIISKGKSTSLPKDAFFDIMKALPLSKIR